jgi:excisionase family DNA binding protein
MDHGSVLTGLKAMTTLSINEPLRTAADIGALLGGIPPKTVLQYARDGRLPCVRIGKHVRFVRADVDAAVAELRSPARTR